MRSRKKILFINSLYSPDIGGGAEIVMQEQLEGLRKRGHEVVVLTTKESGGLSKDVVNGVYVYRAGIKNIYWHFRKARKHPLLRLTWHIRDRYNRGMKRYVKQVIDQAKPDVVVCHNLSGWSVSAWDAVKEAQLPVVQVLHDLYLMCPNANMFNNGVNCDKQCQKCSILRSGFAERSAKVDVIVGVSKFVLNRFLEKGYFSRSLKKVVYNQRTIDMTAPAEDWDGLRALRFGFIGTISEVKGVALLIDAFMEIDRDILLSIAGKGDPDYESALQLKAKKDGRITFVGYVDPKAFYATIDVLVVPSRWNDTLPGVAVEASACGVPVIASKMGGLPEIIRHGENGLIFNGTAEGLKMAMESLFADKEGLNALKANANATVQGFLDFEAMIDEYEEIACNPNQ